MPKCNEEETLWVPNNSAFSWIDGLSGADRGQDDCC